MYDVFKLDLNGNAQLVHEVMEQLTLAVNEAEDRGSVILTLLIHGGESEADVARWPGQTEIGQVNKWEKLLRRIERSSVPVIAIVEGACSAFAMELLTVADYRVAVNGFSLSPTEGKGLIWPGMSLFRLAKQIGEARIRKLFLGSRIIGTEDALKFDLVDEVMPDAASALELSARLGSESVLTDFAVRRRLIQDSAATHYEDALGAHLAACHRCLHGPDGNQK